ncbi:MAG TPA: c-type cytochrome domain-containing protein [Bacteroidota bacterium]|jgi:hypothetical protein|nr:c-type cytochrome domain-containing protein [Bacteroidota bacterium]
MIRTLALAAPILLVLCAFLSSCKDDTTDNGLPIDIVFPDSNVSYGRYVQPLFDRGCAFSGCHGEDTYDFRGFALDSYGHLMFGTLQVVIPGDPNNSDLARRIQGLDNKPRMPLNRTPLTTNQINGIKRWIKEGAQNN